MEIWFASGNNNKLKEVRFLLRELEPDLHGQNELDFYSSPEETADTFEGNARIKAKALAAVKPGVWVIADDSGLCCEGINGLPGVHSARYAGPTANDTQNVSKLLKMLQMRTKNRKAYFHCSIIAISPEGEEFHFEGKLEGEIAMKQMGTNGFGYDPVFIPEGEERALAQMESNEKNRISHRARALEKFIAHIQQ
jgi:XTP/dITP diphosphohydrolase